MFTRICEACKTEFQTRKEKAEKCYRCHLKEITGGTAPEEGDFNTAMILSGQMSEQEESWLQEDLESVDHSLEESIQRRIYEDYDDDGRWDYLEEHDEDE
jgi:hypothetical protein